ncbi:MAG TPA: saccharopine dehydrogenase NADP-binding domain-containing protein [Kofleriaceae bacterium]|nr:saccharopine dehydrogenase NADP-binding domain-containing protein [Kofleriaceae bacterium]
MIYGANGYTGQIVAEAAAARGDRPLLAGRREEAVRALADKLGCPHRVFDLDGDVAEQLDGVSLVLHCAGPFSRTSKPMVDACLARGVHYLDITGEIPVFEACHARTDEAKRAGVVVMPGVGFDVVPSDCLAASLAKKLPGATHLQLAFTGLGEVSAGTAKTMLEGIPAGGAVRVDGKITKVPAAWKTMTVPFHDHERTAVTIPWGDVSTAYHSTGIPNIETYLAMPRKTIRGMKVASAFRGILKLGPVQRMAARVIEKRVKGPDAEVRATAKSELWGRVSADGKGEVQGTLTTPESYRFTAIAALASIDRVLAGGIPAGAHTPSSAFGADFVASLEGCTLRVPS